ncbi:MAG TPA: hypothetical protein VF070_09945 [Streptosporangiaceae bacterium]
MTGALPSAVLVTLPSAVLVTLPSAVLVTLPSAVLVTLPRHPLAGRELEVLGRMRRHGRLELLLAVPGSGKRLIPAEWTSLHCGTAEQGGGGTLGSVPDLLAASALVSAFSARGRPEREQAARQSPAKEDNRAACAAKSAAGPGSGATIPGPAGPAPRGGRRGSGHAAGRRDRQGGDGGPRR